jgi:hypothetical protein
MPHGLVIYRLPFSRASLTFCEECGMPVIRDEMVTVQARGHFPLLLKHYDCDNPDWIEDDDAQEALADVVEVP